MGSGGEGQDSASSLWQLQSRSLAGNILKILSWSPSKWKITCLLTVKLEIFTATSQSHMCHSVHALKSFTRRVFPSLRRRLRKEKSMDFKPLRSLSSQAKKSSSVRATIYCLQSQKMSHDQNNKKWLFKCLNLWQFFHSQLEKF